MILGVMIGFDHYTKIMIRGSWYAFHDGFLV